MKDFLTILLSVLFAVVNVVSVFHGKSWDRTGSGISWHLPFVFLVGGASFVAMSTFLAANPAIPSSQYWTEC